MKPLRSLAALALAAGLVCASGVAAAAAPAGAAAPIRTSASSAADSLHANGSAADCAIDTGYFRTYYDGCAHWTNYVCVAGHHFNISPPSYVSDGCEQTAQLWSGENETGSVICIPAMSASGYLHTAWHSFDITGSGACLALSRCSAGKSPINLNDSGVGRGWLLIVLCRVFGGGVWSTWSQEWRMARCARGAPAPTAPGAASFPGRGDGGWLVRRVRAGRTAAASRPGTPPSRARSG